MNLVCSRTYHHHRRRLPHVQLRRQQFQDLLGAHAVQVVVEVELLVSAQSRTTSAWFVRPSIVSAAIRCMRAPYTTSTTRSARKDGIEVLPDRRRSDVLERQLVLAEVGHGDGPARRASGEVVAKALQEHRVFDRQRQRALLLETLCRIVA